MIHANFQHRSCLRACRLLIGLALAAWLAPAARGEGWPYWPFNQGDKAGKPDKIIALWSDTILTQAGRPPIRGFGGRLMFYEGKKEDPIKVEGTLVVYAFDETDRDANNNRPDRKYVFTPQQLPLHYSKSKIGHSYSVWLPWDEVGGPQKEFTLIVRFEPKDGAAAISDPCRQLLPGRIAAARTQLPAEGVLAPPGHCGGVLGMVGQGGPGPATAGAWGNLTAGPPMTSGGVQPVVYQTPITEGRGGLQTQWQQRHITTATIDVPSGSAIRSAITSPQVPPAGYYRPGSGPVGSGPAGPTPAPWQNYPPPSYPPPGYSPPATPSAAPPGLQLRSGFAPGRQWALGEPLARLSRDRAPSPPHPAGSPSGPASPPGQEPANAAPAGPQGVPQSRN
jgi:hypothetical protein